MFRAIVRHQWATGGVAAGALALACLALPILSVGALDRGEEQLLEGPILAAMSVAAVAYPLAAFVVGAMAAALAWKDDLATGRIYGLMLPVPQAQYVAMRFGAGLLSVAVAAFALLVGAVVATSLVTLPPGLTAYPVALTVRFALYAGCVYAATFAITAQGQRARRRLLVTLGVGLITVLVAQVVLPAGNPLARGLRTLFNDPTVADVLAGHWYLFDV
jgi:hypothetical protein